MFDKRGKVENSRALNKMIWKHNEAGTFTGKVLNSIFFNPLIVSFVVFLLLYKTNKNI